jgi:hypothetical protein
MAKIPDITIMAHLKLVDVIYAKHQPTAEEIITLKLNTLNLLGFENVSEFDLKEIERVTTDKRVRQRQPKKGAYINAFIDLGFNHQVISEWFDVSPANVSWHKMNPPKVEYENSYLQRLRMPGYVPYDQNLQDNE